MSNNIVVPSFHNEDGVLFIECKSCKEYKPETDFYRNNKRTIGRDSECKLCKKIFIENNPINNNSRIDNNNLYQWEVDMAKQIIVGLGYDITDPSNPVYKQFNKRHGF